MSTAKHTESPMYPVLDSLNANHTAHLITAEDKIDQLLTLGTAITKVVKDKITAIFVEARNAWEAEVKTAYGNAPASTVAPTPTPPSKAH